MFQFTVPPPLGIACCYVTVAATNSSAQVTQSSSPIRVTGSSSPRRVTGSSSLCPPTEKVTGRVQNKTVTMLRSPEPVKLAIHKVRHCAESQVVRHRDESQVDRPVSRSFIRRK